MQPFELNPKLPGAVHPGWPGPVRSWRYEMALSVPSNRRCATIPGTSWRIYTSAQFVSSNGTWMKRSHFWNLLFSCVQIGLWLASRWRR